MQGNRQAEGLDLLHPTGYQPGTTTWFEMALHTIGKTMFFRGKATHKLYSTDFLRVEPHL